MHVIALISQKGGVGKSTLAGHLAVEAESHRDGPVALIDTDPQGSLSAWWNVREAETPVFVRGDLAKLKTQLKQLAGRGIELVVIDTPPAITDNIKAVAQVSDLVIIPTRPSPHDLRAVGATVDQVESTKKPMLFIVNGAANRARITADAAVALSQHGTGVPGDDLSARGLCGEHDRRPDGRRARPQIQISFRNYRIMELRKSAAS
jgi:chromosome partitioning protein